MNPILFIIYEDLRTVRKDSSFKPFTLSVILVSFLPYLLFDTYVSTSDISNSASILVFLLHLFVPYVALKISYKSVSTEIDTNKHRLLLTFPVTRYDLIIGKLVSRWLISTLAVLVYSSISGLVSLFLFKTIPITDLVLIMLLSSVLALVFCFIGIAISCTTRSDSIFSTLKLTGVYVLLVIIWRLIPFIIEVIVSKGSLNVKPSDYGELHYFILKLNPVESYSQILGVTASPDISYLFPSTLYVPNFTVNEIFKLSDSPVSSGDSLSISDIFLTIPLSVLIPLVILAVSFLKFRNRSL